jgi:hypothetical protein
MTNLSDFMENPSLPIEAGGDTPLPGSVVEKLLQAQQLVQSAYEQIVDEKDHCVCMWWDGYSSTQHCLCQLPHDIGVVAKAVGDYA